MARDIKQRCARCGKAISDWHYVNNKPVCIDDRLCYRRPNRKYRKQKSKNKVLKSHRNCSLISVNHLPNLASSANALPTFPLLKQNRNNS